MSALVNSPLSRVRFDGDWKRCVFSLLDKSGLLGALDPDKTIIVKPNLVEAIPPPVTTPAALVGAVLDFLAERAPSARVVIAEGCGAADYDTPRAFEELGYCDIVRERSVELVDLNIEPLVRLANPALKRWPEMYLPRLVMEGFIISVPVLKAHTISGVTLTMKNMMGAAPPEHYQSGGHWKKSSFHTRMQESILDLNRYRTPDFTVLDATVGLAESHLGGALCDPAPGVLVAGFDPVAVDAYGAGLLKKDWQGIGHISGADGELGLAMPAMRRF